MKNIYVIPTDKPSRLSKNTCFDNILELWDEIDVPKIKQDSCIQDYNIYITSDEEVRVGDWFICTKDNNFVDKSLAHELDIINQHFNDYKKIILSTDQDLIKDGVQAIDDEFLEWFVKNPSCEFVEVEKEWEGNGVMLGFKMGDVSPDGDITYKIIIPKEEPKLSNTINRNELGIPTGTLTMIVGIPRQETLEEVAFRKRKELGLKGTVEGFIAGAKWHAEQNSNLYSEEEVYNILEQAIKDCYSLELEVHYSGDYKNLKQYFEQIKKK